MNRSIRLRVAALLVLVLASASGWARADREWRSDRLDGQFLTVGRDGGRHFSGRHDFQRHPFQRHRSHPRHFRHRHSGHSHFRSQLFIGIGDPFFWPWYYPPRYEVPARVLVQPPPIYVERGDGAGSPAAEYSWYYCRSRAAYYPYVSNCAEPWERVTPTPAAPQ